MEKERSEIIKKLVRNKFNIDNLKEFTARVLNSTVKNRKVSETIWKEYKDYIESYHIIGDYEDEENKKVYIISVKTKEKTEDNRKIDPTKARTKHRNFLAKVLKEFHHDGALVSFYNDSSSSWRLSFVKLDYSFTFEGIKEKITPAKRLSYVLGEGEGTHTAENQLTSLIGSEKEISLEQLENIFQIEKVTKEFFDKYKEKYLELKEHLENDNDFKKEALKHNEKLEEFSEEFSKKLMGQLAFLYFLQKKGWLGVKIIPLLLSKIQYNAVINAKSNIEKEILDKVFKRISENEYKRQKKVLKNLNDSEADILANCFKNTPFEEKWGNGEKKFIRELFIQHKKLTPNKNFFEDYLEYLFYEALNSHRGESQYYNKFNCKIPFLNGGLFEPYEGYEWKKTNFHIPDELFSNKTETFEGNGILDVFDRFNFTINENEPFETEVAVDPEMLGKVFENLLDVKDRKSKGAFYTPREIVHYMCKESLINYLDNEIDEVKREKIEELLQMGEFAKEYDTHLFEMDYKKGKKIEDKDWGIHISILRNIDKIEKALKNVKIADPAVGSGAFPLGMLIEIVKIRNILTEYFIMHEYFRLEKEYKLDEFWEIEKKLLNTRSLYNLKIETIENCIFGVDIEPSAVEIAKLRLWLSIVVDSENDNINPLPNLDFNFMVGNSLLDEFEGIKLFDEKLLDDNYKNKIIMKQMTIFDKQKSKGETILTKMKLLHERFFKEKDSKEKKEIKKEINQYEWELIKVTLKESNNENKINELRQLQKEKRKPYFLWKLEFAKVFKEKGGFDIVIGNPPYVGFHKVPNKEILRKNFFSATGKFDFYVVFIENAILLNNYKGSTSFICPSYFYKRDYGKNIRSFILKNTKIRLLIDFSDKQIFDTAQTYTCIFLIEKNIKNTSNLVTIINDSLYKSKKTLKRQSEFKEPRWETAENEELSIITKLKEKSNYVLGEITKSISQGIVTGKNNVFLIHKEIINDYGINNFFLKKVYKGKNISKELIENDFNLFYPYRTINEKKNELISEKEIELKNPNLLKYLLDKKEELSNREYFNKSNKNWYELWNPRKMKHFENRKFVFSEIGNKNDFVLVDECFYTDSACGFELKETYQKYETYLFYFLNSNLATYIYKKNSVPKANGYMIYKNAFLKYFPVLIEESLRDLTFSKNNFENDEMFYDLYELTEEEKEIVRNFKN